MALALAITLEAARQNARLDLSGIPTNAATVSITRTSPSGNVAGVRGAVGATAEPTEMLFRDYEIPFGLDVLYTATAYGSQGGNLGSVTASFRVDWADCEAWFTDLAQPTNSLVLTIESITELNHEAPAGVHRVLNRRDPVLTTLPAWTPETEVDVITETLGERDAARALFGSGYPFLIRTDPDEGIGNLFLGVTGFVEERFLSDGFSPERRFRVAAVQVARPDPSVYVPLAPNTYANVKASFATYADLQAGVGSYDALAYTYPADPELSPITPWLPDDV